MFLLSIESSKPEYLFLVYDSNSKEANTLEPFKTKLNDKIFEIISQGPWIYAFEHSTDANGVNQEAPLHVISKETQEEVFEDKCFIGPYVEYYAGTTNDQYIVKVRLDHHIPTSKENEFEMELIRTTSQKELYVHLLKNASKEKMTVDMIQHVLDAFDEE